MVLPLYFLGSASLFVIVQVALVMAALGPLRSSAFLEESGIAGVWVVCPAGPLPGGVWNLVCILYVMDFMSCVRCRLSCIVFRSLSLVRLSLCLVCHVLWVRCLASDIICRVLCVVVFV